MIKKFLKFITPSFILLFIKKKYEDFLLSKYKNLDNREVFKKIYKNKVWTPDADQKKFNFYSGIGSHLDDFTIPYIEKVLNFLNSFEEKKEVLEVGCGDFVISSKFVPFTKKFIAGDIFDEIIEVNKKKYADLKVVFCTLDLTKDVLPKADVCIVRCVLQHLSNELIIKFLKNLSNKFEYLIVTEHYPDDNEKFVPNKDIITGPDIRLSQNSGVDLSKSPFNLKYIKKSILCKTRSSSIAGYLNTEIYKLR